MNKELDASSMNKFNNHLAFSLVELLDSENRMKEVSLLCYQLNPQELEQVMQQASLVYVMQNYYVCNGEKPVQELIKEFFKKFDVEISNQEIENILQATDYDKFFKKINVV